jgi:hypothetical protein
MIVLILSLIVVATSLGTAHADPYDGGAEQAAALGGFQQAENGDEEEQSDEPFDVEVRDWNDSRVWYVRGGISRWTAIFGENYGIGYGAIGGYAYGFRPHWIVRATVGAYYYKADTIANAPPTASSTLWTIPILIGFDYLRNDRGTVRPQIGAGLGAYYLRGTFSDVNSAHFDFRNVFQAYFGAQGRANIEIHRADSNLGFEIGGTYNIIFNSLEEFNMGTPSSHHFWEVGAGIIYFVPEF